MVARLPSTTQCIDAWQHVEPIPKHAAGSPAMDLARLKLFIQVAEVGSLSKAAVLLDSVQSAISRQIAALERECGRRLFDRTGRGVTLTDFGKRVFPQIKALVLEAERVESLMNGKDEMPTGEVRVGFMPSVAELLVAVLFKRVTERFPGIKLRIFEGSNGQLDEWVSTGRIDMGVLYRYGKTARRNEDSLFVVDTFLVGAPGDRVTSQPTISFAKLDGLPLVLPGVPNGLRSMASHGQAYAVHGGVVVWRDVQAGIVSASRIVSPAIKRTMVLATTTQHSLSLAARETATIVRTVAQEHSGAGAFDAPGSVRPQLNP
jgi:LysR family nitrogen assimilation transcriptional regulator